MPASTPLLAPTPLYLDVAELLRQRIFAGQLPPGAWIDELALAKDFGTSRTPLREALKLLAAEGLITMKPRRGAYVTTISEQDVLAIYHLLGLLESDAAASVAARASDAALQHLAQLHHALAHAEAEPALFFQRHEAFHAQLLALSGNRFVQQTVVDLRRLLKLYRQPSLLHRGRIPASLAEHEHLLECLLARAPEAARQAMLEHVRRSRDAAQTLR